jgi:hypothetical protein
MGKSGQIIPHMTRGRLVSETSDTHARVELEDGRHFQLPKSSLHYAVDPNKVASAKQAVTGKIKAGASFVRNAFTRKKPDPAALQASQDTVQQADPYSHGPIHSHDLKPGDLIHHNINGEHHITRVDQVEDDGRKITGTRMQLSREHASGVVEHGSKVTLKGWHNLPEGAGSAARTFHVSRQGGAAAESSDSGEPLKSSDYDEEVANSLEKKYGINPATAKELAKRENATPAAPESASPPAAEPEASPPAIPAAMPASSATSASTAGPTGTASSVPAPPADPTSAPAPASPPVSPATRRTASEAVSSHKVSDASRGGLHTIPLADFLKDKDGQHGVFAKNPKTGQSFFLHNGQKHQLSTAALQDGKLSDSKKERERLHGQAVRQAIVDNVKAKRPPLDGLPDHIHEQYEQKLGDWALKAREQVTGSRASAVTSSAPVADAPQPGAAGENAAGQPPASEEKPNWQIMEDGSGRLHRVNMNEKNPGERVRSRQPVGTDERVLATHDQHGQPIDSGVLQHRQDFMDKAQPGAEFTSSAYPDARFSVLDDGKVLDVTTGRIMTNVPAMANGLDPRPVSKGGKNHQVTWTKIAKSGASASPSSTPVADALRPVQGELFAASGQHSLTERFSMALASGGVICEGKTKNRRNSRSAARGKLHDSIRKALVV